MATDGQTVKIKSRAQRINHRRFKINGAAGFAEGSARATINRLDALLALGNVEGKQSELMWDLRSEYYTAAKEMRQVLARIKRIKNTLLDNIEELEDAQYAANNSDRT